MKKFLYTAATMSLLFSNLYSMNKYNGLSAETALQEWDDENLVSAKKVKRFKNKKSIVDITTNLASSANKQSNEACNVDSPILSKLKKKELLDIVAVTWSALAHQREKHCGLNINSCQECRENFETIIWPSNSALKGVNIQTHSINTDICRKILKTVYSK